MEDKIQMNSQHKEILNLNDQLLALCSKLKCDTEHCLGFLVAVVKYSDRATQRRNGLFQFTAQGTVHHGLGS